MYEYSTIILGVTGFRNLLPLGPSSEPFNKVVTTHSLPCSRVGVSKYKQSNLTNHNQDYQIALHFASQPQPLPNVGRKVIITSLHREVSEKGLKTRKTG